MADLYDVVILGGGAAGMSAAIYSARAKMKTLVIEQKRTSGGQAATTNEIENYPGFPSTTGPELMGKFREHCDKFNVEFISSRIENIAVSEDGFLKTVKTKDGEFQTKTIIIATGAEPRILGIRGESSYRGKGVSYCATCDADFFEELDIVVLGNGNTAVEESCYLTKFVESLTMIVIHDEGTMDADKVAQEQAKSNEKINFVWNSTIEEIGGDGLVEWVKIKNVKTGEITTMETNGVFVFCGSVPRTTFAEGLVDLNKGKYVKVTPRMETNVPGIFAAGDVTDKFLRQVITAASDGATASVCAQKYIEEEENWAKNVNEAKVPVFVAFWSPINKESMEIVAALENKVETAGDFKLVKIDAYKNERLVNRYNVKNVPTILRIENGEVKKTVEANDVASLNELF